MRSYSRNHRTKLVFNEKEYVAEVITSIDQGGMGRVKWHGQSWAAVSLDLDNQMYIGQKVIVMGKEGTSLQVLTDYRETT